MINYILNNKYKLYILLISNITINIYIQNIIVNEWLNLIVFIIIYSLVLVYLYCTDSKYEKDLKYKGDFIHTLKISLLSTFVFVILFLYINICLMI